MRIRTVSAALLLALCVVAHGQETPAVADDETTARARVVVDGLGNGDPWLVADELRRGGDPELAIRFADLVEGPDVARLPGYLRTADDPDEGALEALLTFESARTSKDWGPAKTALATVGEVADGLLRARIGLARGDAHLALSEFEAAAQAYDTAARACRAVGWLRGADLALNRRLYAARRIADWAAAEDSVRRVIALQERERMRPLLAARSTMNLGNVLLASGDHTRAVEAYELAVDALARLDATGPYLGRAHRALGWAYVQLGRYGDAQLSAEEAIETLRASERTREVLQAELQLAAIHIEIGQYEEALRLQGRVHGAATATADAGLQAIAAGGMGRCHMRLGKYDEAETLLREALAQFAKSGDDRGVCQATINLAVATRLGGDLETAKGLYDTALEAAEKLADPWLICNTLQDIALVEHRLGESAAGYESLARADALAHESSSLKLLGDSAFRRAQLTLADGNAEAAVAASRDAIEFVGRRIQGLNAEQSADSRERHAEIYATAAHAAVAADDPTVLFEFLEAGRAGSLLESLENRDEIRRATIDGKLYDRFSDAAEAYRLVTARYRSLMSNRSSTSLRALRAAREAVESSRAEHDAAIRAIQRQETAAADLLYPVPATLEEAQAALADGEVLVLFALLDPESYALVVEPAAARIVSLGPTAPLSEMCAAPAWRDDNVPAADAMAKLRGMAIEPLALSAKTRRVLVSPDGALYQVPLGAVLQSCEVSLVPSATTYMHLAKRRGEARPAAFVVGDPDYSGRPLFQLPGTRKEAAIFSAVEGNLVLLGKAAQESSVRSALASQAWGVVHLAAHGREDTRRPMRSGIALTEDDASDGWLTAAEIYPLSFRADLVTLSACESGGGRVYRGEGLLGLTRAFLFAGSDRVVCSLWQVDDASTRALMERFYALRADEGLSVAAALTRAQAHVRAQAGWEHPYYWAGWTAWGLGG